MNFLKVIIAFHSTSDTILETLEKISGNYIPDSINLEVILIENGPNQNYKDSLGVNNYINNHIKYIYTEKGNKSHALNMAISQLYGDVPIIFTDDDISVNKKWIYNYFQKFKEFGAGHFFGGDVNCEYEKQPSKNYKHLLPQSAIGTDEGYFLNDNRLFFGCNWGCYLSDIKNVGYFNEELGPGTNKTGQESDMQLRLRASGIKQIYIPNNPVTHYVPSNKANWNFIMKRIDRIIHEKKVLQPIRWKRIRSELSRSKKSLRSAPKNLMALYFTVKYVFLRVLKSI